MLLECAKLVFTDPADEEEDQLAAPARHTKAPHLRHLGLAPSPAVRAEPSEHIAVEVAPFTVCGQVCGDLTAPGVESTEVLVLAREHEERRAGRADGEVSEEVEPVRAGVDRHGRHA